MIRNHVRRTTGLAAVGLAFSLSLAACGGAEDAEESAGSGGGEETSSEMSEDGSMSEEGSMSEGGKDAPAVFGEACSEVPTSGEGSLDGMVDDPVATAASNNPLLSTLVTAVGSVDGLVDTLNSAEELTVFAPANSAFEEIPKKQLNGMVTEAKNKGQKSQLYSILAHHVVGENADADAVTGKHETLAGDTLTVKGDPESGMTVSDGTVTANVLCGNVPTANATVYVIDSVLTGVK